MMYVLHITPQAPILNSGGGMGVAQTLYSLIENQYVVDYVGPEIEDSDLRKQYRQCFILEPESRVCVRIWDAFRGILNSRYRAWLKLEINFKGYDAVVMDFTKLDFVHEKIGASKLFVRVHNVEADYARKDYLMRKSFKKAAIAFYARKQEKRIIERADRLIVLTREDKNRLKELYPDLEQSKISIIPVCLKGQTHCKDQNNYPVLRLLITGSLWFGGNYEGILWFIKHVYPNIKCNFELTIAGYHPTDELKKIVKKLERINIIDSPDDMAPYFQACDLLVVPVFDGAGMKVKVAEGLSFGKPIIGTTHALVGYQAEDHSCIICADAPMQFCEAIDQYDHLSDEEKSGLREEAYQLFQHQYSIDKSAVLWRAQIENSCK